MGFHRDRSAKHARHLGTKRGSAEDGSLGGLKGRTHDDRKEIGMQAIQTAHGSGGDWIEEGEEANRC
jgi:hypothetical protein